MFTFFTTEPQCFKLPLETKMPTVGARRARRGPGVMMQDPGSETTSDGPANQNGGGPATEGGAREGPPNGATPTGEVSAADILHLQQHQFLARGAF
ncbi:unnamed protein product [Boreogadus saida]